MGEGMGKLTLVREDGTNYLFAGFLERELNTIEFFRDATVWVEPKRTETSEIVFCQDYSFSSPNPGFVFYALPSWRKDHVEKMGKNTALVTYAADPEFHKPRQVEKKYDVGFVGRPYYKERSDYLSALQSHFKIVSFGDLHASKLADVLSECKVLFNHTRPEIDVNLRFFEAMALGCQVMLRTPALPEFASEGVHYLGYDNIEECVSQIKKLLDDNDLREKITYNSRSHFLANHTYKHRAIAVINHLTEYYERLSTKN